MGRGQWVFAAFLITFVLVNVQAKNILKDGKIPFDELGIEKRVYSTKTISDSISFVIDKGSNVVGEYGYIVLYVESHKCGFEISISLNGENVPRHDVNWVVSNEDIRIITYKIYPISMVKFDKPNTLQLSIYPMCSSPQVFLHEYSYIQLFVPVVEIKDISVGIAPTPVGKPLAAKLILENTSPVDTSGQITLEDSGFSMQPASFTLEGDEEKEIELSITPQKEGENRIGTVTVSYSGFDGTHSTAFESDKKITATVSKANLTIESTLPKGALFDGSNFNVVLGIKNNGAGDANNVEIQVTNLPSGISIEESKIQIPKITSGKEITRYLKYTASSAGTFGLGTISTVYETSSVTHEMLTINVELVKVEVLPKEGRNRCTCFCLTNLTTDVLILAPRTKLSVKYGQSGAGAIIYKLSELKDVIDFHENLRTELVLIDDELQLGTYGVAKQADLSDPEKVDKIVEGLIKKTGARYLILTGGGDIIPFKEMFFSFDNDTIQTDDIYMDVGDDGSYDIVVGRFPDGVGDTDPQILIDEIDSAIRVHPLLFSSIKGFGITTQTWAPSAHKLRNQSQYSIDLYESPPFSYPTQFFNYGNYLILPIHFYDVHGNKVGYQIFRGDSRNYPGEQGKYPFLLSPLVVSTHRQFTQADPVIVTSTSCYGANIARSSSDSIPITFLRKGAIGFVGSTGICYTRRGEIDGCKFIISDFLNNLAGSRIGDAFVNAKKTAPSKMSPELRDKIKAEYVFYGDPTIKVSQ